MAKPTHNNGTLGLEIPREHGFWVMFSVALLAGVGSSGGTLYSVAAAAGLGIFTVLIAGRVHLQVRKRPGTQVLASGALGLLLVPIELAGQRAWQPIAIDLLTWVPAFVAFSFSVRAIFARARKGGGTGRANTTAALLVSLSSSCGLFLLCARANFAASLVTFSAALFFAVWRPRPKQLKKSGMVMAIVLAVALILSLVV